MSVVQEKNEWQQWGGYNGVVARLNGLSRPQWWLEIARIRERKHDLLHHCGNMLTLLAASSWHRKTGMTISTIIVKRSEWLYKHMFKFMLCLSTTGAVTEWFGAMNCIRWQLLQLTNNIMMLDWCRWYYYSINIIYINLLSLC